MRYECEPAGSGMTALAGLPPYLELAAVSGLTDTIRHPLRACSSQKQGWTDAQIEGRGTHKVTPAMDWESLRKATGYRPGMAAYRLKSWKWTIRWWILVVLSH